MVKTPCKDIQPATGIWDGTEQQRRLDWILQLNQKQKAELEQAVEQVRSRGIDLDEVTRNDFDLPLLAPLLDSVAHELERGRGFTLIRGLPVEEFSEVELGIIFWGIGSYLGIGVSQSLAGDRLGHVIDKGSTDRYYTAGGPIVFHMDPVDVVGLLCLRAARSGGASRIVNARTVHNILLEEKPDLLEILYNGFYNSRRGHGESTPSKRVPVYADGSDGLECYLLPITIHQAVEEGHPLSDAEQEALSSLNEIAARPGVYLDMEFQPGDIQFLNNRFILHARTDYEDDRDPALKRHLLRLWLMMPDWTARVKVMDFHNRTDRHGGGVKPGTNS